MKVWRFAPLLIVAACGPPPPPAATPAPALSVAPMPVASAPPASPSAGGAEKNDMDAVTLLVAVLERSLNEGDAGTAEASSSKACWAKECSSLSKQAKKKFKVRPLGDPKVRGTHALATMDILCEGTRKCDRVYLLILKDCAPNAQQTWMVDDVTEDEPKRDAWLGSAPAPCR